MGEGEGGAREAGDGSAGVLFRLGGVGGGDGGAMAVLQVACSTVSMIELVRGEECSVAAAVDGCAGSMGESIVDSKASTASIIWSKLFGRATFIFLSSSSALSFRSSVFFLFFFGILLHAQVHFPNSCSVNSTCLQSSVLRSLRCFFRSSRFAASAICVRFRFTIPAGSRRQCLLLSLLTLMREGGGREGRGQSGGGAVEVAFKRSMGDGVVGVGCFFRKSIGEMRMRDWAVRWVGLISVLTFDSEDAGGRS